MKVVFPYSLKDQEQAVRLAAWIRELAPDLRRHSVLIVHDARCSREATAAIQGSLGATFGATESIAIADDAYDSWPHSCNLMFRRAGKHIELGPNPEPWLWLEPDAIPVRSEWLDAIETEYKRAGRPFMGARVEIAEVPLHMSGVGVYPGKLSHHGGLAYLALETAWDVFGAEQIVPQAHFTKLIEHSWKRDHVTKENLLVTFESWEQVEREISPEAVIYHASKDGSLIERLRERHNKSSAVEGMEVTSPPGPGPDLVSSSNDPGIPQLGASQSLARVSGANNGAAGDTLVCDILIKSYPPDYEWLGYCLRAIDKFATGFRKVTLLIPYTVSDFEGATKMRNVPCRVVHVPEAGEGYLFQQAVKASAHEYTDADYILHVDSDCILKQPITPQTFMRNGKPLWMMTPYDKIDVPWKAITEKFIGEPIEYEFMRRLPILTPRSLHVAAARFCEVRHKMRLTDYILSQPNRAFSEFNMLGALAYTRAREHFEWLDTHAEEVAA